MTYDLPVKIYSSDHFCFSKGRFVVYASDLGLSAGQEPGQRLYSDACDIGLAIQSKQTGAVVRYSLEATDKDADGDVRAWVFMPVEADCKNAATRRTRVVILND